MLKKLIGGMTPLCAEVDKSGFVPLINLAMHLNITIITVLRYGIRVMVFNAIFNNISVTSISWWSVLLVEETGVPGENTVLPANH